MVTLAYCLESVSELQYKEEKLKLKLTVSIGWGERDDWRYKSEIIEVLEFVCQRTGEEEAAQRKHSRILQGNPLKSMAEY